MREITVDAALDQIPAVTGFVNAELAALGCGEHVRIQVDVAIDELFGNIARYAYSPETGQALVRVDVEEEPLRVVITFMDRGRPFDPLARQMPDTTGMAAKDRPIGGLGLFMVKKTMDDIAYEYVDGKNILTIRKRL